MKIDVWSDFVCPFCYIGKRRLDKALENFKYKDEVEVIYHSFQLDPYAEKGTGENMYESLANKYNISYEEAVETTNNVVEQANLIGLEYNLETAIQTNTYEALMLTYFAREKGKEKEYIERVMKAYFTDSLDIGSDEVLASLCEEVGLNREEVIETLKKDSYRSSFTEDLMLASNYEISAVPFFAINERYAISGAQPMNSILKVLEQVYNEETGVNEEKNLLL